MTPAPDPAKQIRQLRAEIKRLRAILAAIAAYARSGRRRKETK